MEMGLPEEVKPDILRPLQLQANIRTCVTGGLCRDWVLEELISTPQGFLFQSKVKIPECGCHERTVGPEQDLPRVPGCCLSLPFVDIGGRGIGC